MGEEEAKSMIASNSEVLGGKPVVKGTRLSVEFIRGLLAEDWDRPGEDEAWKQMQKMVQKGSALRGR